MYCSGDAGDRVNFNQSSTASSTTNSSVDINNIDVIDEVTEDDYHQSLSTSAVLYYCKCKILRPYLRLLAVMGLRTTMQDVPGTHRCLTFWSYVYLVEVILLLCVGYILQSLSCFSSYKWKILLKVLLVISTLCHDMAEAILITSYCLQGQLLRSYLHFLRAKMLQHSMSPLDWLREIAEFQKLLLYFNEEFAPVICIFTIVNITWAASGVAWLLHYDTVDKTQPIKGVSVLIVLMWILISLAPFVQAARLTSACTAIQNLGHEVRVRPFVYKDTPGEDLDAILLYTSSLHMSCKLFDVPVKGRYMCILFTMGTITLLILGQCHML